jgi:Protein of unknown function (DUF3995)
LGPRDQRLTRCLERMSDPIALVVASAFVILSAVHAYWAFGGGAGMFAAVPELNGRPAFLPSALATFAVAIALALCAVLVAASAGLILSGVPARWVTWLAFLLALALIARAVGDFHLVGFFKRVRGTRFARLDSAVYAPLCLVLGVAVFYIAIRHRA